MLLEWSFRSRPPPRHAEHVSSSPCDNTRDKCPLRGSNAEPDGGDRLYILPAAGIAGRLRPAPSWPRSWCTLKTKTTTDCTTRISVWLVNQCKNRRDFSGWLILKQICREQTKNLPKWTSSTLPSASVDEVVSICGSTLLFSWFSWLVSVTKNSKIYIGCEKKNIC